MDVNLCQAAAPIIYDIEKEFDNKIVLLRIDYHQYFQNPEVVTDLSIINIPTVLVIANKNSEGKYIILGRFEGGIDKNALHASIQQAIKSQ